MSQTLALIVAASVLMMTALTVIFLAQGSLTDLGSNSDKQSCLSAVQSQCQAALPTSSGNSVDIGVPQACLTNEQDAGDAQLISGVSGANGQVGDTEYTMPDTADDSVTCEISN